MAYNRGFIVTQKLNKINQRKMNKDLKENLVEARTYANTIYTSSVGYADVKHTTAISWANTIYTSSVGYADIKHTAATTYANTIYTSSIG